MKMADLSGQKNKDKPMRILIYGREGVGKSTFAVGGGKTVLIDLEGGADYIPRDGTWAATPKCSSFAEVIDWLRGVLTDDHDYDHVAIDSLDRLQDLVWDETVRLAIERGDKMKGKSIADVGGGYGRGYADAMIVWQRVFTALDLIRERGIGVVLVAHEGTIKMSPPTCEEYTVVAPKLHRTAADRWCEWCDCVLHVETKTATRNVDSGGFNRDGRNIVIDCGMILRCEGTAAVVAKNRIGLPAEMPWPRDARAAFDTEVAKLLAGETT